METRRNNRSKMILNAGLTFIPLASNCNSMRRSWWDSPALWRNAAFSYLQEAS